MRLRGVLVVRQWRSVSKGVPPDITIFCHTLACIDSNSSYDGKPEQSIIPQNRRLVLVKVRFWGVNRRYFVEWTQQTISSYRSSS